MYVVDLFAVVAAGTEYCMCMRCTTFGLCLGVVCLSASLSMSAWYVAGRTAVCPVLSVSVLGAGVCCLVGDAVCHEFVRDFVLAKLVELCE